MTKAQSQEIKDLKEQLKTIQAQLDDLDKMGAQLFTLYNEVENKMWKLMDEAEVFG